MLLASPAKKTKATYEQVFKTPQSALKTATKTAAKVDKPVNRGIKTISGKSRNVDRSGSAKGSTTRRFPKKTFNGIKDVARRNVNLPNASDPSFSLNAALAGTVPGYNDKEAASLGKPGGHLFDIHEDTPDQEAGNLIQHSTCTLDISDDESRAAVKDDAEKENIPPPDHMGNYNTTYVPLSRKNLMTDEPRTPLGDLAPVEYYGEGCDINSFFHVDENKEVQCSATFNEGSSSPQPQANAAAAAAAIPCDWPELHEQLVAKGLITISPRGSSYVPATKEYHVPLNKAAPIEIWESGSAKGDDTDPVQDGSDLITTSVANSNIEVPEYGLAIQQ